jgi:DtxR family Mn-dependent transcriptional regulator
MADLKLLEIRDTAVHLTYTSKRSALEIFRRDHISDGLFNDTLSIDDSEAHTQACKFEHIISPELDQRICTFLGHPKTCPHGNPIPPGDCCDGKAKPSRS